MSFKEKYMQCSATGKRPLDMPLATQNKKARKGNDRSISKVTKIINQSTKTIEQCKKDNVFPSLEVKIQLLEAAQKLLATVKKFPICGSYDPERMFPHLSPEIWTEYIFPKLELKDWATFRRISKTWQCLALESRDHVNEAVSKALSKPQRCCHHNNPLTIRFLKAHQTKVTKIHLENTRYWASCWINRHILNLESLSSLSLKKVWATRDSLCNLAQSQSIWRCDLEISGSLSYGSLDELEEILASDFPLKTLAISSKGCSPEKTKFIFKALRTNKVLEKFTLKIKEKEDQEDILNELPAKLAEMIRQNETLKIIDLIGLVIDNRKEAAAIAEAARSHPTLERLDLDGLAISEIYAQFHSV